MFGGMQKLDVKDLKLGMYVCELDRPWTDTPFIFQGFFLDSEEQIAELRKLCDYVVIDLLRQRDEVSGIFRSPIAQRQRPTNTSKTFFGKDYDPDDLPPEVYPIQHEVEHEMDGARAARKEAENALEQIVRDIKHGRKPAITPAREAVSSMVESVIRNPNASVWLTHLKDLDSYTYAHAVDVTAYLLVFGRHLGLPKEELRVLGLGGLLLDIGKSALPLPLLQKRNPLNEQEYHAVRDHVAHGVRMVRQMDGVPKRVLEMVQGHHERFDGSGYPLGVQGKEIPTFCRMAAIVDTFDAITSERPYAEPMSCHEALRKLYDWRGKQFHVALVEQFIECLGIYPVGTIVELSTGEVAIVLSQNRYRQLRPRLVLILDKDKKPYGTMDVLDLIDEVVDSDGYPVEISHALEPGMYGINPREFYLL